MKKQTIIKLLLVICLVLMLLWINQRFLKIEPVQIKEWILSFGLWAPLLYIALYSVRPLVLFPASILSIAGGLAFGPYFGTVYTMIGATAGAILAYLAAGKLKIDLFKTKENDKAAALQRQLEQNGFLYVLILRLIPLFHFDLISYSAGVSKVKLIPFASATFIGIIPGTFAFTFLGSSLAAGDTAIIVAACMIFLLLLIVPLFFKKQLKKMIIHNGK